MLINYTCDVNVLQMKQRSVEGGVVESCCSGEGHHVAGARQVARVHLPVKHVRWGVPENQNKSHENKYNEK